MSSDKQSGGLKGELFLAGVDEPSFSSAQVELLRAIAGCGSISAAARQVGISYKTAWDRVEAMNNLSATPLVSRSAGGARGGGTRLTGHGEELVRGFSALQEAHEAFLRELGGKVNSLADIAGFIRSNRMHSSARNQYRGRVSRIRRGAVSTEVELAINDEQSLTALITNESLDEMALKPGLELSALIKSSWILLSPDRGIRTSARNRLLGTVLRIVPAEVSCEVVIDLGGEKTLCAIITRHSLEELGIREGQQICAFFKASSVILMKE